MADKKDIASDRAAHGRLIAEYVFENGPVVTDRMSVFLDLVAAAAEDALTMDVPTCEICGRDGHWNEETQSWSFGCWDCY